ncbi:PAQR family membrane homeostasis protein TrhA [Dankookia sp. P2]|uniref:PAQR family membrane homeostasis protein TrhA n=1 Tax=Dankookia sp. P2 TaxID=3423955 RepID=UPI003D67663B
MAPTPPLAPPAAVEHDRGAYAADAAVHALGLTAAALACLGLLLAAPEPAGRRLGVALGLYAGGLLAMLGCSAAYNLAGAGRWKRRLQRLDHAAIFLMIAGTYTPITLLGIGGGWGWGLFGVVWAGALCGAALKLLAPARIERAAIVLYLLLGWTGLVATEPLLRALDWPDLVLLLLGGLFYSLGVRLHLAEWLRFHTALWHGCVLAGAACHYAVVLRITAAAG